MSERIRTFLRTKLHRPSITSDHILRENLIEYLEKNLHKPLTLLSAGAGYGKSMLVSSWMQQKEHTCIWISLTKEDNDLKSFLTYVFYGIQEFFPGSLGQTKAYVKTGKLPPLTEITNTLVNEIDDIEEDFVLVLDDFHLISDEEVLRLIGKLLQFPPTGMHLVISTREDPPLRLSHLRAHNRLTEIRMIDLIFNKEEIISLFDRLNKFTLSEDSAVHLSETTEGWITGLVLISSALYKVADEASYLKKITKRSHLASEFLFEEVFTKQSERAQELLLACSLFDEFCIELLQSVYGDRVLSENKNFIQWLRSTNLFLIPLDRETKWFRFHHIFQELLQGEVRKKLDVKVIEKYHLRASEWFLKEGYIEKGIQHAIAGNSIEKAIDAMKGNTIEEFGMDQWHNVDLWLGYIPEEVQAKNSFLLLTRIWSYYGQGRIPQLIEVVDHVERNFEISDLEDNLQGQLWFIKGLICYFSGRGEKSMSYAQEAVNRLSSKTDLFLGEAELLYAMSLHMCGEKELAIHKLEEAIARASLTNIMYLTRIQIGMNYVHILSADFIEARKWSSPLKRVMDKSGSDFAQSWAEYLDGYIAFNLFDLKEAYSEFDTAIKKRYISDMNLSVNSHIGAILSLQLMGETKRATDLLNQMLKFVKEINTNDDLEIISSFKARFSLLQGDPSDAIVWARTSLLEVDPMTTWVWIEVPVITGARALIKGGDKKDLERASELLLKIDKIIKRLHFECHALDILVLMSLAHYKLGEVESALAKLKEAALLAAPQRWLRPFVEVGPEISEMLGELIKEKVVPEFLTEVGSAMASSDEPITSSIQTDTKQKAKKSPAQGGGETLTVRELETVQWLSQGLRNQEIADKMFISVDAVKKHLYRTFQKLDVRNRIQLVQLAQSSNLLEGFNS